MRKGPTLVPLAPAHLAGLGAFQAAAILACVDIRYAAVPLVLFLVVSLAAPFFPGFGYYLPIVSRGCRNRRAVALTFDDGPDPATTRRLLELLGRHGVPATFFVTGLRAAAHRGLVREILSGGHAIGNHSYDHSPVLMLKSTEYLRADISAAQSLLAEFGVRTFTFRPPVGITNPRLWRVLLEEGLYCVNFSRRAGDAGNRRIGGLSRKILRRAKPGEIILLHEVAPGKSFNTDRWIKEVESIITGLRRMNLAILPLEDLIGRTVMTRSGGADLRTAPVAAFYDSISASYDSERGSPRQSPVFTREYRLFEERYLPRLSPEHRILEIGAGTGIYTIPLARKSREVTAVEISENMTARLKEKAEREGLRNIICKNIDITDLESAETYDGVCAFSSFEYMADLSRVIDLAARHLKPGGVIYFTTAHRSLFRFFIQIGNALRQGLWLHGRSVGEVRGILSFAGFERIEVSSHVMKWPLMGGLLLEAMAVKPGGGG